MNIYNKMRQVNYFYKIQNKINGKFYYGIHKTNNIDDGYMGSGKRIHYALEKYGIGNFEKEILKFFDTYEEALNYEANIVNEILLQDPSCYNLALGGKSDIGFLRQGPALINKETSELIKPKNIDEYYQLFNSGNYDGHTKGKTTYQSDDGQIFFLDVNDQKIKELKLNGITKNKIVVRNKDGNCFLINNDDERYLNGELITIWKNRKHKEESKRKIGEKNSISQKGAKNSQYGTCWITNEKTSQKIHRGDLIPEGWRLGRKIKEIRMQGV